MLATIFLVATFYPRDAKLSFIFVITLVLLIYQIRFSLPQSDFVNYYGRIKYNWSVVLSDMYYGREFVFWYGSKLLYEIIGDERVSYLILDSIIIVLLFSSLSREKNYVPMFYFIFFISIIGLGNVYRQYIVTGICVFILLREPKLYLACILLAVSFFIHNMVLLVIPILVSQYGYKKSSTLMMGAGLILLALVDNYKGVDVSGTYMTMIYLLGVIILTVLFLYYATISLHTAVIGVTSVVAFYFLLPINQAERVIMMILVLYIMLLVNKVKMTAVSAKLFLVAILIIPTVVFPTSYSMINTKSISER
jgi:hypothetical protein